MRKKPPNYAMRYKIFISVSFSHLSSSQNVKSQVRCFVKVNVNSTASTFTMRIQNTQIPETLKNQACLCLDYEWPFQIKTGTKMSKKVKLERDIPNLLPMSGKRIKIFYKGVQRLCPVCFDKHSKNVCKSDKVPWIRY